MSFEKPVWLCYFFIVGVLMLFTACDDDVNPFIGTELPYTVWGMVNPDADTQAVRVFLIDDILKLVTPNPLDASVSIVNVGTNDRFVLQDSVIQLSNTDYRHIFWAEIDVNYHDQFRVEVERSDGELTKSANVEVPGPISLHVVAANTNSISELIQSIRIDGNPPSTPRIDVTYNAFAVTRERIRLDNNSVTLAYGGQIRRTNDSLWLDLDLLKDFRQIREDFDEKELQGFICLDDVVVDIHVGNEEWRSPIGVFDANFLVEPGTFSNIENGFGFFGAGYVKSIDFTPPDLLLVRAGYFDCAAPIEG